MKKLKSTVVLLIVIMLAGLFATCNKSEAGSGLKKVVLAVYANAEETVMYNELAAFMNIGLAEQGIELSITCIPADDWAPYYQKVLALAAAGNSPDIIQQAEYLLPKMIAANHCRDITEYAEGIDTSGYFEQAFKGASFVDNKYYGLPNGISACFVYFNKDIFDAAGVPYPSQDWENPNSLEEIQEMARKLTSGEGASKIFGFGGLSSQAHLAQYMIGRGGSGIYYPDGEKPALLEPENFRVYEIFADMTVKDKTMLNANDVRIVSLTDMFVGGRLAMYVDGTWRQRGFLTTLNDSAATFKPGIACIPGLPGKAGTTAFLDQWVMMSGTKDPDSAWVVMKELIGDDVLNFFASRLRNNIPISKALFDGFAVNYTGTVFDEKDLAVFQGGFTRLLPQLQARENTSEYSPLITAEWEKMTVGDLSAREAVTNMVEIISKGDGVN